MKRVLPLGLLVLLGCSNTTTKTPPATISDRTTAIIPEMMKAYGVDGMTVSVVAEDQTLLSKGYGVTLSGEPFTPNTPCSIYSATKAISSFTLASMVEDQVFDIEKPLNDYLDDVPEAWAVIPFWRLLNHTSGITMIVNKPEFAAMAEDPKAGNRDIYNQVKTEPLDYVPGKYSRYRQSGYAIAEMIYADKLGQDWHELVSAHLTGPAGTTATFNPELNSGKRVTPLITSAGGFQTTANDMSKIFKVLNSEKVVSRTTLETLLYTPKYNFNDYSLGSILSNVEGEPTLGHRGGGRANIRYAPRSGIGVLVCTDDRSNKEIMVDMADMLMQDVISGKPAPLPVQFKLYTLKNQPAKTVIAAYDEAKTSSNPIYDFSRAENVLNSIGYTYFAEDKMDDAIEIFKLNIREFPNSANAYDSLGEAFFKSGDLEQALENYNQVLALNPGNRNAETMIKKIKSGEAP